jgi:hypothetical protein
MQQIHNTAINYFEKFELAWRYVFIVKIAHELITVIDEKQSDSNKLEFSENQYIKKISIFLYKIKKIEKPFWKKLTSVLDKVSKFSTKIASVEVGMEARQIENHYEFNEKLDKFGETIKALVQTNDLNITISVEDIDDIWDTTEQSKPLIVGLLNTIRKLNSFFYPKFVILVFIRSDI